MPSGFFATENAALIELMYTIASIINGNIVEPELLDALVETAVEQFLRGAGPLV
ncbi:hypothetical protein SK854_42100 [Lentzea sp. BCCO 10_0061]|uniref:TetR family transcriptional regulator n=1 Tax=Lentzea sokolovensis TaxID=3095429 RepID=A0ABU4VAQ0_9PSEU|nr:hypothetical protein [Lentzea sp. BCCO 10_0061]MDX8148769.1 hypothetical protein [Lentzea sp. BCCO 10_0061]